MVSFQKIIFFNKEGFENSRFWYIRADISFLDSDKKSNISDVKLMKVKIEKLKEFLVILTYQ